MAGCNSGKTQICVKFAKCFSVLALLSNGHESRGCYQFWGHRIDLPPLSHDVFLRFFTGPKKKQRRGKREGRTLSVSMLLRKVLVVGHQVAMMGYFLGGVVT